MKKNIIIIIIAVLLVIGLGITLFIVNSKEEEKVVRTEVETITNDESEELEEEEEVVTSNKIKLSFDDKEVTVTLNDSEISKEFSAMLPMTIEFEDFNSTEKIGYLEKELDSSNAPDGYDSELGDFSYYVPWGNISIFYKDFRYSSSLVKLGTVDGNIEDLQNIADKTPITIERID